jgi:hypothetical protein
MSRACFVIVVIMVAWCMPPRPLFAAGEPLKESSLAAVDKRVTGMNDVQKKLYKEIAKAREENDIRRVNCLLTKLNLVKGLLKASDRAKAVLLEAFYGNDPETAGIYKTKIESYADSAKEVERSIDECRGVKTIGEGTTMVYIRPEGSADLQPSEAGPWDWNFLPGSEGYPAVPPASPFR